MSMQINSASIEQAATLSRIAHEAKAYWRYLPEQIHAWREQLTVTPDSIRKWPTFVVEIDHEAVAFYQLNSDESPPELEHFWVHPRFVRRGIGRAMLAHAKDYLAGLNVQALAIDADPNAEPFYLACGAVRIGEMAAPIAGRRERVRPQLLLRIT